MSIPTEGWTEHRRGAALLLVLAVLVLVVAAATSVAGMATTEQLRRNVAARVLLADDLAEAAEAAILHWLTHESMTVTLPPEVEEPRVEVLHDAWRFRDLAHELQITAWDQCGMVPWSEGLLRGSLPLEAGEVLEQLGAGAREPRGVDQVTAIRSPEDRWRAFPAPRQESPVTFSAGFLAERPGAGPPPPPPQQDRRLAIGALVATHNPGVINVNTAPIELVRAAMHQTGRGGIEQIIQSRASGELATVPPVAGRRSRSVQAAVSLAPASTAWAFRIDARVGRVSRSWWVVYGEHKKTWKCVQRLAITE